MDREKLASLRDKIIKSNSFDIGNYDQKLILDSIETRRQYLNLPGTDDYLIFVSENLKEIGQLINTMCVGYSFFFRNPVCNYYLETHVFPTLLKNEKSEIRVWSAGCARGEEPYSIAIMLQNYLEQKRMAVEYLIFSTDINTQYLKYAEKAEYSEEEISNVKFGDLKKYFEKIDIGYRLKKEIRDRITLSNYDLLDTETKHPPSSVYGHFDIVICCNLLIYFNAAGKKLALQKLERAIPEGGFLVLGESESLPATIKFKPVSSHSNIYKKIV